MSRSMLRDLTIVLSVALALRVLAVLTLPLIITNDGAFYLHWASEITSGQWPDMPEYRTPAYPHWLAAVLFIAGDSVHAVLCSQQILGVATAVACWWLGRVAFGPRVGLVAGLLVAVDPWLLAIASFALSDMLSIALPLVALASVVGLPGTKRSTVAGVLLGAAVLTRPTSVAWLPGVIVLAMLAPAPRMGIRWLRAAAVVLACALAVMPWVVFNATRGVQGIAQTEGLALWGGLARSGQLDPAYRLPEALHEPAKPLFEHTPPERDVMRFYQLAGRTEGVARAKLLSDWSRASLRSDPAGYAIAAGHAAAWQANAALPGTPYAYDPMLWIMKRLGGTDAVPGKPVNLSTGQLPNVTWRFEDASATGPLAAAYRAWPLGMTQRFPQLLLGVLTLIAIAAAGCRKRWTAVAVLASSMPIVFGHAIILQPFSRYSISAWMIWWIGGVASLAMIVSAIRSSGPTETKTAENAK